MNKKDFYQAIKERRSIYGISNEQVLTDDQIVELVNFAVKYTPSAFNSQSARAVVLLGDHHRKLWDITEDTLRKIVPADSFSSTQEKMNGFRNGYGTVLFFEDQNVIRGLQEQFGLYKDNFPVWSEQSSGMLQYVVWTALDLEGMGANLQHYNPLIDDEVKRTFNIPEEWKLVAQMPFGKPVARPDEKQFNFKDEHVKVFK
jgi:uncharacterized protein